ALYRSAKERVKLASNIQPRRMEDLREEERIVVYRALIHQLIVSSGATVTDSRVQHLFAEMVQAIFDIDRMLYFVAPEWWVPRTKPFHNSPQNVGLPESERAGFEEKQVVEWGGAKEHRPDNYYITEDSTPARLGSSLGWVLQLDGDNMRNAFLNAPWVKAVLPILPGKEKDALEWLRQSKVEGTDGLSDLYAGDDLKGFEDAYFAKHGVHKPIT